MSRFPRASPGGVFKNLTAGSYGPLERLRVIASNVGRKMGGRGCCGNYGEPGC
jgi:hypothetical protein